MRYGDLTARGRAGGLNGDAVQFVGPVCADVTSANAARRRSIHKEKL